MKRLPIANGLGPAPVFHVAETVSTMNDIRELRAAGHPLGTVVVADYQSAGRGRGGTKGWYAPPGSGLLFSFVLGNQPEFSVGRALSLRLGNAVCDVLRDAFGMKPLMKWPNDVLVGGRKICGILCESKDPETYVGIGLNCGQRDFGENPAFDATSISLETGRSVDTIATLEMLLRSIADALRDAGWRSRVEERLYRRGEAVRYAGSSGIVRGVGESGELILQTDTGRFLSVTTGTVVYR